MYLPLFASLFLHRYNEKMPKYGLSMICVFPYMDGIVSVFSCVWTDSLILSKYGKIYEYDSVHVLENMVQKKPIFWHILGTTLLCRSFVMV